MYSFYTDELSVASEASNDTQTDSCDFSACNGYTLKTEVFDNEIVFGQCQFPAQGTKEDYFCFVNANSACEDKVISYHNRNTSKHCKFSDFFVQY